MCLLGLVATHPDAWSQTLCVITCLLIAVMGWQVHGAPVAVMRYNAVHDVVISSDEKGALWLGSDAQLKGCRQYSALQVLEPLLHCAAFYSSVRTYRVY